MDNDTIKKLAIALFILNLIGFLLTAILGSNGSVGIPALSTINNDTANLQSAGTNIANAPSFVFLAPLVINDNGLIGAVQIIANVFIVFINLIAKVILFVIAIISFLITAIILVVYLLFVFVPSLLLIVNLGIFNVIFVGAYALLLMVLAVYSVNYIIPLIRGFTK